MSQNFEILFALAFILISLAAAQKPVRTVCSCPVASSIGCSLQSRYAIEEYYSSTFTAYTWNFKYLASPTQTPNHFVASWLTNGTGCNVLLGPGLSSMAVAMSPVIDRPWVDWSATSISLSDKSQYPMFSRVIPTDVVGAALLVSAIWRYGWKQINVLSVDTAYGNSFATGISEAMQKKGGTIEISRTISQTPSNESVLAAFDQFAVAQSRVIAVVMSRSDAAFALVYNIVHDKKLQDKFIFLFAENFCSATIPLYLQWSGAICATYAVNATMKAPFLSAYRSRNQTPDTLSLSALGWNVSLIDLNHENTFASFAHDAAYLVMSVYNSTAGQTLTSAQMIAAIRAASIQGVTGRVTMASNGDRPSSDAFLYNIVNGSQVIIGSLVDFNMSDTGNALDKGIFTLGNFYAPDSTPSAVRESTTAASLLNFQMLVAVVVGAVTFIVFLIFANKLRESDKFKRLVKSGLWVVFFQVGILFGLMILRLVTAITVAKANYPAVFSILYLVIISFSLLAHVIEIAILVAWFHANVQAKDDLPEEDIIKWEFRMGQVHLMSLGMKDIPVIAMSFAALLQDDVTVVLLLSLCASCIFLGMKVIQLKERIVRFLSAPPPPIRRFRTLRSVVRFIVMARRFTGSKGFTLVNTYEPLNSKSSDEDISGYYLRMKRENEDRIKYLRNIAKQMSAEMHENDVTGDEFFAVIAPYMDRKYNPPEFLKKLDLEKQQTQILDFSMRGGGSSTRTPVCNPLQASTTSVGGLKPTFVTVVPAPHGRSLDSSLTVQEM